MLCSVPPLPRQIQQPWETVCKRRGGSSPMLRYEELVLQNWRVSSGGGQGSSPPGANPSTGRRRVSQASQSSAPVPACSGEGLCLAVPVFGTVDEERVITTLVRMHVAGASLVAAAVRAQEAAAADDGGGLVTRLLAMRQAVLDMRAVMASLSFAPDSPNSVDPASVAATLWQLPLRPRAAPPRQQRARCVATAHDAPLLSGTQSPLIHLLDALLGRPRAYSQLGASCVVAWRDAEAGQRACHTTCEYDARTHHPRHHPPQAATQARTAPWCSP